MVTHCVVSLAALLVVPCISFSPLSSRSQAPRRVGRDMLESGVTFRPRRAHSAELPVNPHRRSPGTERGASTVPLAEADANLQTVFDFATGNATMSFERIDDAIMGGISLSALKDTSEDYASWSGICRTDGGGFCGMRTLPFREPLDAAGSDGIFVDCRLASDDEPERRVWKITCRTDTSRGEMVYQAAFPLAAGSDFSRVFVPFDDFQLVRGPRVVPDAPKLNVTGGIYQIGMSLSKFVIGVNTTELENFRPGFFDLQIRQIGFFSANSAKNMPAVAVNTLSKAEVKKKRPLLLKILLPISKIFFSEQANRRKSAMKILQKQRGLSRAKAILWGIKTRAASMGFVPSLFKAAAIIGIDSFRTILGTALKVCLFYPLGFLRKSVKFVKKNVLRMQVKELPSMT